MRRVKTIYALNYFKKTVSLGPDLSHRISIFFIPYFLSLLAFFFFFLFLFPCLFHLFLSISLSHLSMCLSLISPCASLLSSFHRFLTSLYISFFLCALMKVVDYESSGSESESAPGFLFVGLRGFFWCWSIVFQVRCSNCGSQK